MQRSEGRVATSSQLIQPSTDRHLWAKTYEREMPDVLTLGLHYLRSGTPAGDEKAIEYFQLAITKDPNDALS